jgi:hypothetical protein
VVQSVPENVHVRVPIVKAEWFWVSVQNEGSADEKNYLFEDVSHFVWYCWCTLDVCHKNVVPCY